MGSPWDRQRSGRKVLETLARIDQLLLPVAAFVRIFDRYLPSRWQTSARWSGGRLEAAGQGEAQVGLFWPRAVALLVVPVLSFLLAFRVALISVDCLSQPASKRPLVMG